MSEMGQVIKDFVLFGVSGFLFAMAMPTGGYAMLFALVFISFGFVPFGWKWASNIVTAVSLYGIVIKLMLSVILGFVAGPVTLGKDIISMVCYVKNRA